MDLSYLSPAAAARFTPAPSRAERLAAAAADAAALRELAEALVAAAREARAARRDADLVRPDGYPTEKGLRSRLRRGLHCGCEDFPCCGHGEDAGPASHEYYEMGY